jgi:solute:Na+ symporter, SSS family
MGATPELSWLAVLGYSCGSAFPAMLLCWLGPLVRERTAASHEAFNMTDFGRERYGRVMQVSIATLSGFYMFVFIVAELTAISSIFQVLTNNYSNRLGIVVTLSLGLCTTFYTALAGLPASIVTDKFQGLMMFLLVSLLTVAVSSNPANRVSRAEFALASNWTTEGLTTAVTLIIAICCAEMFNQGTWQRVWAAKSIPDMRKGFLFGSFLVFMLMMFFGVMGMIAYANSPEAYDNGEKFSYLAFFDLLEPMKPGWHILTLILVVALCASSVDTLQNGIASIFFHDLVHVGWNTQGACRAVMVVLNIPSIYLASQGYNVLALFLVADIVCATSVFPVFCGLQTKDIGFLKAPTELGAFLGCISGVVTVVVNGVLNNASGGLFEYFWLNNGAICTLCGTKTMVSFIVTPLVSLFMTYLFSYVDIMIRGERAREPLISLEFDKKNEKETMDDTKNRDLESTNGEKVVMEYDHHDTAEDVDVTA